MFVRISCSLLGSILDHVTGATAETGTEGKVAMPPLPLLGLPCGES